MKQRAPLYLKILTIIWILSAPLGIYHAVVLRDTLYGIFAVASIACSVLMFGGSRKAGKVMIGIWIWASVFPIAWQLDHGFDTGRSLGLLLTAVYIAIICYWLRTSRAALPPPIQTPTPGTTAS